MKLPNVWGLRPVFRIRIRFIWFPIRNQHFMLNTDPDPGFWWPKIATNLQLEKEFNFLGSKTTIYLFLGLRKGRPNYRRSLQPSKENIQHFKTWNLLIFVFLWVILPSLIWPDPDTDPLPGSGSETLIKTSRMTLYLCGQHSCVRRGRWRWPRRWCTCASASGAQPSATGVTVKYQTKPNQTVLSFFTLKTQSQPDKMRR